MTPTEVPRPAAVLPDEATATQEADELIATDEQNLRLLIAAEPYNSWAIYHLMSCLMAQNREAEALETGLQLLDLSPVFPEAYQNLTRLLTTLELERPYDAEVVKIVEGLELILRHDGADEIAQRGLSNLVAKFLNGLHDRYRPVMIATVGGAGTYFTIHFLQYLNRRLGAYSKDYNPLHRGGIFEPVVALSRLHLFNVTSHALCPGFEQNYRGAHRAAWDQLIAEAEPERVWDLVQHYFDPSLTPETRIVHIYRDPREWVITTYRAAVRAGHLRDSPESLRNGVLGKRLKRFVAQYFSYRAMAELFPKQIMLLPFETLIADPFRTFQQILSFFGVPDVSPDLIRSSIKSSSPQALMKMEDRTGSTTGPTGVNTHFDRNRAERERIVLTEQDLDTISRAFGDLSISLSEFGARS